MKKFENDVNGIYFDWEAYSLSLITKDKEMSGVDIIPQEEVFVQGEKKFNFLYDLAASDDYGDWDAGINSEEEGDETLSTGLSSVEQEYNLSLARRVLDAFANGCSINELLLKLKSDIDIQKITEELFKIVPEDKLTTS